MAAAWTDARFTSNSAYLKKQSAKDVELNRSNGKMEASKTYDCVLIPGTRVCGLIWGKGPLQRIGKAVKLKATVHSTETKKKIYEEIP